MNPNNQNKYHQQPTLSQAQYNPNLRAQKPDKTKKQQKQGKTYFKKKKYRQIHRKGHYIFNLTAPNFCTAVDSA